MSTQFVVSLIMDVCGHGGTQQFEQSIQKVLEAWVEEIKNRECLRHYNRPWMRTHIDGPPPKTKNCVICRKELMLIWANMSHNNNNK